MKLAAATIFIEDQRDNPVFAVPQICALPLAQA